MTAAPSSSTLALCCDLMRRASVTPADAGCLDLIGGRLAALGFRLERIKSNGVDNLWARLGDKAPLFAFAGHTDVVPTGDLTQWQNPPFEPTVDGGRLFGRGAADMKGSLAAMVVATEEFLAPIFAQGAKINGSIAYLLTSDEEGPATDGTVKVLEHLKRNGEQINYCIVGEPSSAQQLGDQIRNGRRGSLHAHVIVRGVQGHVAYPELVKNPIHLALPAFDELARTRWDDGNEFFPPTSFQISNIRAGTGAPNVVPGQLEVRMNFRFSSESSAASLQERTETILRRHGLDFIADWSLSGAPFLTRKGRLLDAVIEVLTARLGVLPVCSTGGGTSDGRFIAPTGAEVVELGPCNATIHQINENVTTEELEQLKDVYRELLRKLVA